MVPKTWLHASRSQNIAAPRLVVLVSVMPLWCAVAYWIVAGYRNFYILAIVIVHFVVFMYYTWIYCEIKLSAVVRPRKTRVLINPRKHFSEVLNTRKFKRAELDFVPHTAQPIFWHYGMTLFRLTPLLSCKDTNTPPPSWWSTKKQKRHRHPTLLRTDKSDGSVTYLKQGGWT